MYFDVKVRMEIPKENGSGFSKKTFPYLVEADGITEAERIILEKLSDSMYDKEVISVKQTNYDDVYLVR